MHHNSSIQLEQQFFDRVICIICQHLQQKLIPCDDYCEQHASIRYQPSLTPIIIKCDQTLQNRSKSHIRQIKLQLTPTVDGYIIVLLVLTLGTTQAT